MPELIVATAAFVVALLGTGLARSVALSRGLLDMPTPRGSHSLATPRGGGIAIVVPVLAVACWLLSGGGLEQPMAMGLLVGGASMAVIGLLDDIHRLSVALRLAVQFVAVGGALWVVGGMSAIWIGGVSFQFGWTGHVFAFLACLWFVNLYNFMDGIDGFAAGEAVFIGTASAWLLAETGGPAGLILLWTALAGACGGFLVWNWAPAKIFMGDTGSAFLGFVIAILLAYSAHTTELSIWTAGILTSPFLADATVTLLRRLARGERVHLPHRTHAYQLIAWRWRSHSRVSALLQLINIAIILPAAWWSVRDPAAAVWICTLALTTMAAGALAVGAGGREPRH